MTIRKVYALSTALITLIVLLCLSQYNLIKSQYISSTENYRETIRKSGSTLLYPCIFQSLDSLDNKLLTELKKRNTDTTFQQLDSSYKVYYNTNQIRFYSRELEFANRMSEVLSEEKILISRLDSTSTQTIIRNYTPYIKRTLEKCYKQNIDSHFLKALQKKFPSSNIQYKLDITFLTIRYQNIEYILIDETNGNYVTVSASPHSNGQIFDSLRSNTQGVNFHMQMKLSFIWPKKTLFFITTNGSIIFISIAIIALLLTVCLITIISILKQKKLEDQKDDFINNITHEVKTPLTTIDIASNSLLKTEIPQEEVIYLSRMISKQSERLHHIFNQVLSLAINQHSSKKNYPLVDIHAILLQNIQIIQLNYQKTNTFTIIHELKASNAVKPVDTEDLNTIFINVLTNALIYNTKKTKTITLSSYNLQQKTILVIKDNGDGIAKKDLPFIFDQFYRGAHHVDGLGLGLFHAKKLIDKYGFKIRIESSLGNGTTVTISF